MAGGYQKPSNPAPVSGPGRLAKRTDGGPAQPQRIAPGGAYGERKDMAEFQTGAPMSASPTMLGGDPAGQTGPDLSSLTPFGAPSDRPDEPVTAGVDAGPGPGSEALGLGRQVQDDTAQLARYLPIIEKVANDSASSKSLRLFVQYLKGLQ